MEGPVACRVASDARFEGLAAFRRATRGIARTLLYGLTPTDPAVFVVAGGALALTALIAAWLPARRAERVDPLLALRHE